ncbi:MAG: Tocopherol O-methyltransferase [Gammaproteobacteria bacterium]|nr:Tocopherol O-methyltransferase [Gammaproteobacteria bacterium]
MAIELNTDQPLFTNRMAITSKIAKFWDQISFGWRNIWGPHIHHGFYEQGSMLSPLQAQEKLIDKLAEYAELKPNARLLDVGCGMGGSSLYLEKHYSISSTGISLSQKQVDIATEQARLQQAEKARFKVEDALAMTSFHKDSFDIVWSLESCEQFFDKSLFIQEAYRVLKPGGRLMLATWCSDKPTYCGHEAKQYEKLCKAFDLPYMPTIEHYKNLLNQYGFKLLTSRDWSSYVAKSWDIGVSLVNAYSFLQLLKLGGLRGLRFAKQIRLMQRAFRENRVRYGVFVAEKRRSIGSS